MCHPKEEYYRFDKVFASDKSNEHIYREKYKPMVHNALKGYNMTVFAFGQTNSGKTFTMFGDQENDGLIQLVTREIFANISVNGVDSQGRFIM